MARWVDIYENCGIYGSGSLAIDEKEGTGLLINKDATLRISHCRVDVRGRWGIAGKGKLIVENSTVGAEGSGGSISGLASFTLKDCYITEPAGAVWNEGQHAVCDASGNIIKGVVVIRPRTVDIEHIRPDTPIHRNIYNFEGVKINIPFDQLPSGVYIVDGKKVLKNRYGSHTTKDWGH
ncbi:hypothetical protein [Porphyromonas crevioricanis]|uniref:hypothetical protein n=1 Tax=Porphyromonas crevioricanis TaxID=393921 RepID=UPI0011AE3184|nr:hypothetical protein [Porphyromonas crevioricanis]